MDKLSAMNTFVLIVEAGSLTGAADTLGTSLPTVVRTLAALERHLEDLAAEAYDPPHPPHRRGDTIPGALS